MTMLGMTRRWSVDGGNGLGERGLGVERVAALLAQLPEVFGVQGEQPALGEALVVDPAGVLALGVGAEERASEQDLAAGAAAVALTLAAGAEPLRILPQDPC